MSTRRRVIIITLSVLFGTLLSAAMLFLKRGGSLDSHDYFLLATNLSFSLVIIFAIGYFLVWRKKD